MILIQKAWKQGRADFAELQECCGQWWTKGWGPEARLKRGHLMTSSYSANRDKTF